MGLRGVFLATAIFIGTYADAAAEDAPKPDAAQSETDAGPDLSNRECVTRAVAEQNMLRKGQTFQSGGVVTSIPEGKSDIEGHMLQLYGNQGNGEWTLLETISDGQICTLREGKIFLNIDLQNDDAPKTARHIIMAIHGNGDNSNAAYHIYANEATERWYLGLQTAPGKTKVIMGGTGYTEENNPTHPSPVGL